MGLGNEEKAKADESVAALEEGWREVFDAVDDLHSEFELGLWKTTVDHLARSQQEEILPPRTDLPLSFSNLQIT